MEIDSNMIGTSNSDIKEFKYMQLLAMLYMTTIVVTIIFSSRLTTVFGHVLGISMTLMPFRFAIPDIYTEVYGYERTKKLIWTGIFCEVVFLLICFYMLHTFHASKDTQTHYYFVFSRLGKILAACVVAHVLGNFISVTCISKWKILLKGRLFFLRSLGATFIGMVVYTSIILVVLFYGTIPNSKLLDLVMMTILVKIIMDPITAVINSFVAPILKKREGIDCYDFGVSYNPFK